MNELLSKLKALSDSNRLRIVGALLHTEELCACQIIEFLKISGATISRHLSILVNSGILKSRKDGRWVFYSLDKTDDLLLEYLDKNIERSAKFAKDKESLKKITSQAPEEICRKQRGTGCC